MSSREAARESLMQLIFQMEVQDDYSDKLKELFVSGSSMGPKQVEYIDNMVTSIRDNLEFIDGIINDVSVRWKTNRMPKVDLAICRVAIGELYYSEVVPDKVSINEAVILAKKYGEDDSYKFINGILGKVKERKDAN